MDRVRNQEMRRRDAIDRELVSKVDKRMDEYRMGRMVLMTGEGGGRIRGRPRLGWLDGWREGGLGQQRNDGGGCATMRERSERVESPGTYYVIE